MDIKRGFTYIGGVRKFKVLIDGNEVEQLKLLKTVKVNQPENEFTIQFRTMMVEKSKVFRIKSNSKLHIQCNVNPMYRLFYIVSFILLLALFAVPFIDLGVKSLLLLLFLATYLGAHYGYFAKNYITLKVYDQNDNRIDIEEIK